MVILWRNLNSLEIEVCFHSTTGEICKIKKEIKSLSESPQNSKWNSVWNISGDGVYILLKAYF